MTNWHDGLPRFGETTRCRRRDRELTKENSVTLDSSMRTATIIGTRKFAGRTATEVQCPWCENSHWLLDCPVGTTVECLEIPRRSMIVTEQ